MRYKLKVVLIFVVYLFSMNSVIANDFNYKNELQSIIHEIEGEKEIFNNDRVVEFLTNEIELEIDKLFSNNVIKKLNKIKEQQQFDKEEALKKFVEVEILERLNKLEKIVANDLSEKIELEKTNLIFKKTGKIKNKLTDSYLEYATDEKINLINQKNRNKIKDEYKRLREEEKNYSLIKLNLIHFGLSVLFGILISSLSYSLRKFLDKKGFGINFDPVFWKYYLKNQIMITFLWLSFVNVFLFFYV